MDWFAVVSNGSYPTPTPTTTQRASFAASWGLLSIVPYAIAVVSHIWTTDPWTTDPWTVDPWTTTLWEV